jgi:hypothetical protein
VCCQLCGCGCGWWVVGVWVGCVGGECGVCVWVVGVCVWGGGGECATTHRSRTCSQTQSPAPGCHWAPCCSPQRCSEPEPRWRVETPDPGGVRNCMNTARTSRQGEACRPCVRMHVVYVATNRDKTPRPRHSHCPYSAPETPRSTALSTHAHGTGTIRHTSHHTHPHKLDTGTNKHIYTHPGHLTHTLRCTHTATDADAHTHTPDTPRGRVLHKV